MVVFDLKNITTVSKVGEKDGNDPGDDVGNLELDRVLGVKDSED